MVRTALTFFLLCSACAAFAQQDPVLMRIGGKDILRSEFEYAYNKVRGLTDRETESPDAFAGRFVNLRLKVAAAEAAGMDTLRSVREPLEEYSRQLAKSYLTDEAVTETAARQLYDKMKDNRRAGKVRVVQIFKYLPQTVTAHQLSEARTRMDSIYATLQKEQAGFDTCVLRFSDEKSPFWLGWLQMPLEFEDVVFEMQPGEISRPFFTPQGLHIVKVLERQEMPPFDELKGEFVRRLTRRPGRDKGTEALVEKLKKEYHYTPDKQGVDELLAKGHTDKTLFVLDGKAYTGTMFALFAAAHPAGVKHMLDGFVMKSLLDHEYSLLHLKHPDYRLLMQERREELLLAEITRREIGEDVAADEAGLAAYFEQHRQHYRWKTPHYKGVVIHATTKRLAKQARKFLKTLPEEEWMDAIRLTFNAETRQIEAEQGLFALGDNVYVDDAIFKKGDAEPMPSFPFTTFLGEKQKGPESYREVRDLLLNDYRNHLEEHWTARLRAAFKVEINEEVLKTVNNH